MVFLSVCGRQTTLLKIVKELWVGSCLAGLGNILLVRRRYMSQPNQKDEAIQVVSIDSLPLNKLLDWLFNPASAKTVLSSVNAKLRFLLMQGGAFADFGHNAHKQEFYVLDALRHEESRVKLYANERYCDLRASAKTRTESGLLPGTTGHFLAHLLHNPKLGENGYIAHPESVGWSDGGEQACLYCHPHSHGRRLSMARLDYHRNPGWFIFSLSP